MAKILIGCRLPSGLVLQLPESEKKVTLAGLHSSKIIGATHITTEVDADFWEKWKSLHKGYQPLKTGAIFEASSAGQAEAKGKELAKEKTGFEPLKKDAKGITPAEKD